MSHNQHTEDEARTKECKITPPLPTMMTMGGPIGPLGALGGQGWATPAYGYPFTPAKCSASACMHWRGGGRAPRIVERLPVEVDDCPINPPPTGWVRNGDEYVRHEWSDVGYCGLAGEP